MKPLAYSLQFRGRVTSNDPRALRFRLTAPTSTLATTIGPDGIHSAFDESGGGEAAAEAELLLGESSSFFEVGTIVFGSGNIVRYRSACAGRLTGCPDPNLRHGVVIHEVVGGDGQFADAEGFITSNFLVSDTGEVTNHQLGVIFVHDRRLAHGPRGAT
ncbi:MAG: hypothetical protein WAU41_06675 [Gaiellaceae bacterium]